MKIEKNGKVVVLRKNIENIENVLLLKAKKQRFEELTKGVLKSTQKKFSSTWLEQQQYQ